MKSSHPPRSLRIVVVTADTSGHDGAALAAQAERDTALRIGVLESGDDIVASLPPDSILPERVAQLQPHLIVVDSESDERDVLACGAPPCASCRRLK